jgi:hypothetical protein
MKFPSIDAVKKLQDGNMRKKDIAFWGSRSDENIWRCWLSVVIDYLEQRAKRKPKLKTSVSVNLKKEEA